MLQKLIFIGFVYFLMASSLLLRFLAPLIKLFIPKSNQKRLVIFEPFFPNNAGYEYRSNKWKEFLEKEGFSVKINSVYNEETFIERTSKSNLLSFHFGFFFKRFIQVVHSSWSADIVIVRRALLLYNDYGHLFLDKLLLTYHPQAILDYDDDLTNHLVGEEPLTLFGRLLFEERHIFYQSLKLYKNFIAGSNYLKELNHWNHDNKSAKRVLVLPTCVDYLKYEPKTYVQNKDQTTLGWIGSNGNQKYLDEIVDALNEVHQKTQIELLVISGNPYANAKAEFDIKNKKWSLNEEIDLLKQIDIGLMPLPDNQTTRAKCGFKLIQYMGLGIVGVASAISTNKEIIEHGVNGFLVEPKGDWARVILEAIKTCENPQKISAQAQKKIAAQYSFEAHHQKLVELLNTVAN